jgi:hypothetical protein
MEEEKEKEKEKVLLVALQPTQDAQGVVADFFSSKGEPPSSCGG